MKYLSMVDKSSILELDMAIFSFISVLSNLYFLIFVVKYKFTQNCYNQLFLQLKTNPYNKRFTKYIFVMMILIIIL